LSPLNRILISALSSVLLQTISPVALATDALSIKVSDETSSNPSVTRIYLVRSANSSVIALRDSDLDAPAEIRRLGNVLSVKYQGVKVDVESTILVRGGSITVLDRYLPSDESDE
jgi:hypothetical protein